VAKAAGNGDDLATTVAKAGENGLIIAIGNVADNAIMQNRQALMLDVTARAPIQAMMENRISHLPLICAPVQIVLCFVS
jgi:hypothetical protein